MIQPGEMVVIVALAALVPLGMLAVTYFRGTILFQHSKESTGSPDVLHASDTVPGTTAG